MEGAEGKSNRQLKKEKRQKEYEEQKKRDDMNLTGKAKRIGAEEDPEKAWCPVGKPWFVISFTAPINARQKSKNVYVKIRGGAFATAEEAHEHAQVVHKVDPDFDVHVVRGYNWLQIPPPPEHYEEVPMKYDQEKLDKVMDNYYAQQRKGRQDVQNRMRDAKQKAAKKNKVLRKKILEARQKRQELGISTAINDTTTDEIDVVNETKEEE